MEYTYGDSGWKDLLTKWDGQSITYDTMGNPLTYRDGLQFQWDGRQLAVALGCGENINAYYQYDANGIRTLKTVGGVTTKYYLDGNRIVREESSDGSFDVYYDGNGQMQKLVFYRQSTGTSGGVTYFPRYNLMGDVTALLDTQGNVVVKYAYDAWGKVLSVTDANGNAITDEYHVGNQNPFRYRGYYYDTETGFYYLQSRYYDPETGRFINADGVLGANGDLIAYNMFAYCSNMPTAAVDYSGYGFEYINGRLAYSGYIFLGEDEDLVKGRINGYDTLSSASDVTEVLTKVGDSIWATIQSFYAEVGGGTGFSLSGSVTVYGPITAGGSVGATKDHFYLQIGRGRTDWGYKETKFGGSINFGPLQGSAYESIYHPYSDHNCTLPENPTFEQYLTCPATVHEIGNLDTSIGTGGGVYILVGGHFEVGFDNQYWGSEMARIWG